MIRALYLAIAVLMVQSWLAFGVRADTINLLTNPGAEAGSIAGWTASGSSTPGVDSGSFDPGINPHTGSYDFYGQTGAEGMLTQNVSLVGNQGITAGLIDGGSLTANVSFWEQGLNQGTPSDDARVVLFFYNASNSLISSMATPEVDSHNGTWEQYVNSYAIPVGTRTIAYEMDFIRHAGSDLDAFVDDNSLTVSFPSVVPEPSSLILTGIAIASGLGYRSWKRRKSRRLES